MKHRADSSPTPNSDFRQNPPHASKAGVRIARKDAGLQSRPSIRVRQAHAKPVVSVPAQSPAQAQLRAQPLRAEKPMRIRPISDQEPACRRDECDDISQSRTRRTQHRSLSKVSLLFLDAAIAVVSLSFMVLTLMHH